MVTSKQPRYEPAFRETAKSICEIEDESLRRDFNEVLSGAEYGIQNGNARIANECVVALKHMTFYLCRTIGGPAALSIFDGLVMDSERPGSGISAMMLPPGDIVWEKDKRCPGGGAGCSTKKRYSCLDDGRSGCAGKGPNNRLSVYTAWGVALLYEGSEVAADFHWPDNDEVPEVV